MEEGARNGNGPSCAIGQSNISKILTKFLACFEGAITSAAFTIYALACLSYFGDGLVGLSLAAASETSASRLWKSLSGSQQL